VKRLLVVALAAVPLIAVATPAAAAPAPSYIPDGVCKWCRRCCQRFAINSVMKNTITARVNRIVLPRGSQAAFDGIIASRVPAL